MRISSHQVAIELRYLRSFINFPFLINKLGLVGRGRDVAATAGPVDVNVLALGVLVAGKLGLDVEGVGTEVITLGLEKVGGEVLGAVTVEP